MAPPSLGRMLAPGQLSLTSTWGGALAGSTIGQEAWMFEETNSSEQEAGSQVLPVNVPVNSLFKHSSCLHPRWGRSTITQEPSSIPAPALLP